MNLPTRATWTTISHFDWGYDFEGINPNTCNEYIWFLRDNVYYPDVNSRVVNDVELCSRLANKELVANWDYGDPDNPKPDCEHENGDSTYTEFAQDIFNDLYSEYFDLLFGVDRMEEVDDCIECHYDNQNSLTMFDKAAEKEVTYYLFGGLDVKQHYNHGIQNLINQIQLAHDLDYPLSWSLGDSTENVEDMMGRASDYGEWCGITLEEYNQLKELL